MDKLAGGVEQRITLSIFITALVGAGIRPVPERQKKEVIADQHGKCRHTQFEIPHIEMVGSKPDQEQYQNNLYNGRNLFHVTPSGFSTRGRVAT
jgi:hypothetical protein